MEIRAPDVEEVDELADLWVDLAADQRRHGSHLAAEANRSRIREILSRHVVTDEALVAGDDRIQGFVTFTVEQPTFDQRVTRGVVENLYVRPAARDRGAGSDLLAAAEATLAERDCDVVALEVLADNADARRFYERHGYEPFRLEVEKALESDTHTKGDG